MAEYDNNRHLFDKSGQYDAGLKSLMRMLRWAFGFLLVLIIGMTVYFFTFGGYFAVKPQEAVIVLRFGKFHGIYQDDWHWYFPYPVSEFIRIRTAPQTLSVNFLADEAELSGEGDQGRPLAPGRDGYLLTADANILHTGWSFNYIVTDPRAYYETLLTPGNPLDPDTVEKDAEGYAGARGAQTALRNTFRQAVHTVTSARTVEILYSEQREYREEVEREFSRLIQELECGVTVGSVVLQQIMPPRKAKTAFDEVATASNVQEAKIAEAREYRIQVENEAQSRKTEIIAQAALYRRQVVSEVKAESEYFKSINVAYRESPDTVLMALYNDLLAEVLEYQDSKFILGTRTPGQSKQIRLQINPEPRPAAKAATSQE